MKSMREIFRSYAELDANGRHCNGTDKCTNHDYGDAYESLFCDGKPFEIGTRSTRENVRLVMEVGVADGACMLAWREIFPNATIVGLDIHHSDRAQGDRIEFYLGDQRVRKHCEAAAAGRQFDMIVEDAVHHLDHTLLTLFWLWPYVKPGGIYVVEEWENVGGDRDRIRALWPSVEILGTCGPHIQDEPLVVFRKPVSIVEEPRNVRYHPMCDKFPKGEQCILRAGHEGHCKWGRGD